MTFSEGFYFGWILYNLLCLVLMMTLMSSKQIVPNQKNIFLGGCIGGFLILAIWGNAISPDSLNYRQLVSDISSTKDPFTHIETFYIQLIHFIGDNFYLYQLCVYIPIFTLMYAFLTKGVHLQNPILFLSLFAVLVLYDSIVGRSYLFAVVYLIAVTLLAKKKTLLGGICLLLSCFLHKVAFLVVPLTFLYFIPWKLNRRNLIILSFLLLLGIIISRQILTNYLSDVQQTFNSVQGIDYLNKTEGANAGGSIWWQFIYSYRKSIKFLLAFWVLYHLRKIAYTPKLSVNRVMYFLLFWITILSFFFSCLGLPDQTISGRILNIGLIPLCYLFSLTPNFVHIKKTYKICFFLICFIYMIFNNAYIVGVSHIVL